MKTGLYIHYPFCLSKCAYCDFNSVVNKNTPDDDILKAFIRDLNYYHNLIGSREISTIYFGGGTPSLMPIVMIKSILEEVHKLFNVKEDAEITIEANPITAEVDKFKEFKNLGINRISIGIQSFSDKGLKTLGRAHDLEQATKALEMAKNTFDRVSFDLIYGWEGQTLSDWREELKQALEYEKGHLSIYQLTVYEGTTLASLGGKEIDEDTSLAFQQETINTLSKENINQYEISNYAKDGEESQHNLIYWHYDDYIGIGAGASGRLIVDGNKKSFKNEDNIGAWIQGCNPETEELSNTDQYEEYLLMGLRLNQGIDMNDIKNKTGVDISKIMDSKPELKEFIKIKYGYIFATEIGRNCLNTLLSKLV
jgi:putative oxygen-independent coproporphyrinogen III oxidase